MSHDFDIGEKLASMVDATLRSYRAHERIRHIGRVHFPSSAHIGRLIEKLLELVFPGFVGRQDLTEHNIAYHVGELLPQIGGLAFDQIFACICHEEQRSRGDNPNQRSCDRRARETTEKFLELLPAVRTMLAEDVEAALRGDPAAASTDEIVIAYPGLLAVSVYRLAHELHRLEVPLMPRVMTEWAHRETGVDIHPGASIGHRFFIDHGTGVVIGETTHIGDDVKLYQGVTLGAVSFPRDEAGNIIKVAKRHPTVENNVTIYASATILGGKTVIGEHSQVGGSVFLTASVPPYSTVVITPPDLKVRSADGVARLHDGTERRILPDYQI